MTLTEYCERYLSQRDLSATYANTLRKRSAALQEFCGQTAIGDVMTHENVNRFLETLALSPHTVNKYRQDFLAIWRAAGDEDLLAYPIARRIKQRKRPALIIECLDHAEVSAIVMAAETKLKGCLPDGRSRRHYWSAVIRAAWDTGLRRGDLWRLAADTAGKDGSFKVVQNKTGKIVRCRLRPSTVEMIRKAGGNLSWPLCRRSFTFGWNHVVGLSGIDRKAQFKWLRRGAGSLVESLQPGAGAKLLGNTDQVFRAHYDAQFRPVDLPQPPEIDVA